ncbi:hypothetical protein L7F22_068336 [Adiantum nelumboides]|nr:hypothetical protein [Adiantum nelumboides]
MTDCAFSRPGSPHAGICPSKTDRILSKYRPIAPKPASLASSSTSHAPRPVDANISSLSQLCFSQVPEIDQINASSKRTRKRKRDTSTPFRLKGARKKGCVIAPPSSGAANSWILPKGSQNSAEAESAPLTVSCLTEATRFIHEDEGFMARAAASVPSSLLPDQVMGSRAGAFTEMIRGITGLSTAAGVYNLMHPSSKEGLVNSSLTGPSLAPPSSIQHVTTRAVESGLGLSPASHESLSFDACKPIVNPDSKSLPKIGNAGMVTDLKAHADTPSCLSKVVSFNMAEEGLCAKPNSVSMSMTPMELGLAFLNFPSNVELAKETGAGLPKEDCADPPVTLSLLPETPVLFNHCNKSLSIPPWDDHSCNIFNWSEERVALMDDNFKVLWCNNVAMVVEGSLPKQRGLLYHLYSLGVPAQLGKYQFSVDGSSSSLMATLWGFLKRSSDVHTQDALLFEIAPRSEHVVVDAGDKVATIVPLPLRLIRSSVSLMSITKVQTLEVPPLCTSIEVLKQQHEVVSSPVVISNSCSTVKWVNAAYKQMIGQPECPWLGTLMHDSSDGEEVQSPRRLAGQVVLRISVEIPHSALTFSGWVDVQWRNCAGERRSMTLPCDVTRRIISAKKTPGSVLFVWKLDIQASLRLTCGE